MKTTTPKQKAASPKKPAATKPQLLVKATEMLAPGDDKLVAEVRAAAEKSQQPPFEALLAVLSKRKRVVLLDTSVSSQQLLASLSKLEPKLELDSSFAVALGAPGLTTERMLEAVAAKVEQTGSVLLNLETRANRWAITTVPRTRVNLTLAAMTAAGHPARIMAAKPLIEKAKAPAKRVRGGVPLEEWPDCSADPSNTWRYFIDAEGTRSLSLRKWPSAFDVMQQDLGPVAASKSEKKSFPTPRDCALAYAKFYEELRKDGWLQYSAQEHAKELKSRSPRGTPQK